MSATPASIVMPEPGFHLGMPELEYDALPAIRSTTLNEFKGGKTPAHVHYSIHSGGKPTTDAMAIGTLLHLAVLEPDRFADEVVVMPAGDGRYKEVKRLRDEFKAKFPVDKYHHVDADTKAKVTAMAEALRQHESAGLLLSGRGNNEVVVTWRDDETGLDCKARLDRATELNEWPVLTDVKSTRNAAPVDFNRSVHEYGYNVQAAHYLAGCEAVKPIPPGAPFRRFMFLLVENFPPYLAAVREIDDVALEEGRIKRSRYLRTLKRCLETGSWPGFDPGVEYCTVPGYTLKEWNYDN